MARRVDPATVALWADLVARLQAAPHGSKVALVQAQAAALGISLDTAYARMKTYGGWAPERKRRASKTAVTQETLLMVAGIYKEGVRENRKQVMTVPVACSIAAQSGQAVPVSPGQMARLMRGARLDRRSQDLAPSFVQMRSDHPNHVHQIDPSLCLLIYMKGRQRLIRESEFYKNKLDGLAQIKLKVWRYVRTDHASGLIDVFYIETAGENQQALFEFLMWTWGRQPGRTGHGVPRVLVWDKGSANTSHGIKNLLVALEVEAIAHAAETPWAKGQVEKANDIVERSFESRLRFEPVDSCAALNAAARAWAEAYNSHCLPGVDSRLHRQGARPFVRAEAWLRIRAEQLRELPEAAVCARLLEGKTLERTVNGQTRISFRHPAAPHALSYDLKGLAEIHRGDVVEVAPLLIGDAGSQCMIRLRWSGLDGQEQTWRLAPIEALNEFGLPLASPTWDGEFKAGKKRDGERAAEALARVAYPEQTAGEVDVLAARRAARQAQVTPFGGTLNAVSHLSQIETPTYLPRAGEPIGVSAPEDRREAVPLVRALLRLSQTWGRPITDAEHDWLAGRFGAAVPAAELERLLAVGTAGDSGAAAAPEGGRPALAVVR